MLDIQPMSDRVLLRRVEQPEMIGSIYIPEEHRPIAQEAVVISVGPGRVVDGLLRPMTVKPGDRVLIGKFTGQSVKVVGPGCVLVREDEIIGVVE